MVRLELLEGTVRRGHVYSPITQGGSECWEKVLKASCTDSSHIRSRKNVSGDLGGSLVLKVWDRRSLVCRTYVAECKLEATDLRHASRLILIGLSSLDGEAALGNVLELG